MSVPGATSEDASCRGQEGCPTRWATTSEVGVNAMSGKGFGIIVVLRVNEGT